MDGSTTQAPSHFVGGVGGPNVNEPNAAVTTGDAGANDEAGNAGFIVQRRRGGAANFEDLETYEKFAPLRTKGPAGGSYVYLDDTADVGTWVYRVLDCDVEGVRSAVCQKLVEIESKDEQQFTFIVGGVIATLAVGLVIAGIVTDPIQTTSKGSALF